ncbi:MAG TPA: DUF167 domain-containing protein [Candidatus Thermoplasmatota archaeon]|nr:DUF167 domain-containing protein [Candidatus Thermoplasmatota archaeon]
MARSPEGVLLRLHVVPGASNIVFPAGYNEWRHCLEIKVKGLAQDNKANVDVLMTLAAFFHCSPKDLRIVHGEKSREKTILLANRTMDALLTALEEHFHGS